MPDLQNYSYYNIESYVVSPGNYTLKQLKYMQNEILYYTFSTANDDVNFSIKAGEVLYVGNLIINIRDNMYSSNFFKDINIQDNYDVAKSYVEETYPYLSLNYKKG